MESLLQLSTAVRVSLVHLQKQRAWDCDTVCVLHSWVVVPFCPALPAGMDNTAEDAGEAQAGTSTSSTPFALANFSGRSRGHLTQDGMTTLSYCREDPRWCGTSLGVWKWLMSWVLSAVCHKILTSKARQSLSQLASDKEKKGWLGPRLDNNMTQLFQWFNR